MDLKIAKMAAKHLGIFYIKICRQELYKFAQSGHTVGYSNIFNQSKYINNGKEAPMTCQRMMYDVTKSNESELWPVEPLHILRYLMEDRHPLVHPWRGNSIPDRLSRRSSLSTDLNKCALMISL